MKTFYLLILISVMIAQSKATSPEKPRMADTIRLEQDLRAITKTERFRNFMNVETLDEVAKYVQDEFLKTCDTVYYQTFTVDGKLYRNVIGSIGVGKMERIVVGAHYDVAGEQEGADDNASGVAGILELARLLKGNPTQYRIDLVAYTLEEPPYFRTENMGSHFHAKWLYDNHIKVKGMICFDMIGYFNDEKGSQSFPIGFLRLFYGNRGNFITVVQKFGRDNFGRQVKKLMKKQKLVRTRSFKGPASMSGVDFSDHRNYWKFGYSAVMVTNTAFYRNQNYHLPSDTVDTLDLPRMAAVIDQVYLTLTKLK